MSEGWEAVTHLRVAEQSELGRATVYRHWPTSADLLRDTLEREMMEIVIRPTTDLRSDLKVILRLVRREIVDRGAGRALAALIDRAEWNAELSQIRRDLARRGTFVIRERVTAACALGELDPDLDPDLAVSQLAGPILFRRLVSGEAIGPSFIAAVVDDFIAAHSVHGLPTRP
jgi:AcrR family transcriptional regulator